MHNFTPIDVGVFWAKMCKRTEKKEKGIPDDWGFNLPFELFSRLGLFLSLGLQRVSSVVVVGVRVMHPILVFI